MWNRVSGHNLGGINAFLSFEVVNEETGRLIEMAMEKNDHDEVPPWPGVRFNSGTEEYRALLGKSPYCLIIFLFSNFKANILQHCYLD